MFNGPISLILLTIPGVIWVLAGPISSWIEARADESRARAEAWRAGRPPQ